MEQTLLSIEHLKKSYDDNLILDDINLEVHQGEVIVLVGPSGCGKSTMLRCINALEPIQGGEIKLNGEKIDVILYDKDPVKFITNALSPAKDIKVTIKDESKKEALAVVPDDNLSLAIGRKGQNVKLASRLTHYKIEVKSQSAVDEENAEEVEASEK